MKPPSLDQLSAMFARCKAGHPVYVYRNNETGERLWAVCMVNTGPDTEGYWLTSCRTKRAATNYCLRHNLIVVEAPK